MRKFKTKRKNKRKNVIFFFIAFIFVILFIFLSMKKLSGSYSVFVNFLLERGGFKEQSKFSLFSHFTSNLDVLLGNYYFDKENDKVIVYKESDEVVKLEPIVYIYSTHDQEMYNDNKNGVIEAGKLLEERLNYYNINCVVEKKRVSTYLNKEGLEYSSSYVISRRFLEDVILNYSSLNYFIDVHRDSVDGDITTAIIDNNRYAKVMFVLGLDNGDYLKNKNLIANLNDYLNNNYSGVSRGIYEKKGKGVNGVYNQDFNVNTILIEIGGVDNSFEEVTNSIGLIAEALYHVIGKEN